MSGLLLVGTYSVSLVTSIDPAAVHIHLSTEMVDLVLEASLADPAVQRSYLPLSVPITIIR